MGGPRLGFWVGAGLTLVADLLTKHAAFGAPATAAPGGLPVIPQVLHLTRHVNTGMVWGLASGQVLLILGIIAVVMPLLVVMAYACRAPRAPLWALGLILGGAAGNVYDRLAFGGVRDFILMDLGVWPADPWPVYNIADVAIVAGFVAYLCWSLLLPPAGAERIAADDVTQAKEAPRP